MRLLLIEDDVKIASFVIKGLRAAGFTVDHAGDGQQGLSLGLSEPYDLIIVDVMLPGLDGIRVIEKLRQEKVLIPMIILSARDSVSDRVKGLQAGSDDYLSKPFAFAELLARVQALMRRSGGMAEPNRLSVADLSLDLATREVKRAGQRLDLQPLEFSLLVYLMRNSAKVVSNIPRRAARSPLIYGRMMRGRLSSMSPIAVSVSALKTIPGSLNAFSAAIKAVRCPVRVWA